MVGWLSANDGTESAVAWGISGDTIVGPETIAAGVDVWAPDVNDVGMVVATFEYQAYQWTVNWDGSTLTVSAPQALTATVLDPNGVPQTITLPRVTAINEFGDVCGTYQQIGVGWYQAYLRSAAGEFTEMPKLIDNKRRGTANYSTSALNNAVDLGSVRVVGQHYIYDKRSNFVVDPGGPATWKGSVATDLQDATDQTSSLFLKGFNDVSDAGWLAGFGWTDNADPRAIVLIPL